MVLFLLLVTASFLVSLLLLLPALLVFALQFFFFRTELKKDYPEDWKRYSAVLIFFEVLLFMLFYTISTVRIVTTDIGSIYSVFFLVIFVLLAVMAAKFFIIRRYCFGEVLFTSGGWVGVRIRPDLFSKIAGADYAVQNPLKLKLSGGDRVKLIVKGAFGRSKPSEVIEKVGKE